MFLSWSSLYSSCMYQLASVLATILFFPILHPRDVSRVQEYPEKKAHILVKHLLINISIINSSTSRTWVIHHDPSWGGNFIHLRIWSNYAAAFKERPTSLDGTSVQVLKKVYQTFNGTVAGNPPGFRISNMKMHHKIVIHNSSALRFCCQVQHPLVTAPTHCEYFHHAVVLAWARVVQTVWIVSRSIGASGRAPLVALVVLVLVIVLLLIT